MIDEVTLHRVALAIHRARFAHPQHPRIPTDPDDSDMEYAYRLARAALNAAKERTP